MKRNTRSEHDSGSRRKRVCLISAGTCGVGVLGAALAALYLTTRPSPGSERVPASYTRNSSHYLMVRDGTQLAADVWLPADLQADERIPALIKTTRYWRAHALGPLRRLLISLGQETVPNLSEASFWNDQGYALVLVDARGSGASFGQRPVAWSDAEVADMGEFVLVTIQTQRVEVWSAGEKIHPVPFGLSSSVLTRSGEDWLGPDVTHP